MTTATATNAQNIYTSHGFKNRKAYLIDLCDQYDVSRSVVFSLAQFLGENEDFDGLISALEDYEDCEDCE